MSIIGCAFFPHPPIVLPEVGKGQERKASETLRGMEELAAKVAALKPEVIAVVTPHGAAFSDVIAVRSDDALSGDMKAFSAAGVKMNKTVDKRLMKQFEQQVLAEHLLVALLDASELSKIKAPTQLDHGALVPLTFIDKLYQDYTLLHITPGGVPLRKQYAAGKALKQAAEATGQRVLVLASGDLSHKLSVSGPYGFDEAGPRFDERFADAIRSGNPARILQIEPALGRKAGECGWKPAAFALGALDGSTIQSEFISYEGPFGVGYLTALLTPGLDAAPSAILQLEEAEAEHANAMRQSEDGYVRLARAAIERYVTSKKTPTWAALKSAVCEVEAARMERRKAGVFVSLHQEGELRGCMGTILPVCANVAEEIIRNAVTACSEDPRFDALEPEELPTLEINVDELSPFEPVQSMKELDPVKYGVIVEKGGRRGLLLPRLDGVNTVKEQVSIACRKAGFQWRENDGISLFRFTVERHT